MSGGYWTFPRTGSACAFVFKCAAFVVAMPGCGRKIFGEVLDANIASKAARRTSRLEAIVHHIGIALGGRPAASLARRLMLPVSRDTLLRVVRRRAMPSGTAPVRIVGIDDFAWKRGQRYGTIVRSGTTPGRRPVARPRGCNGSGMAGRPPGHHHCRP
jgi:hypothetical protein